MSKKFLPYDPDQSFLLAPNPRGWLEPDHPVFFVIRTVKELDLDPFYSAYKEGPGAPPHDPRLMVSLLLYGNMRSLRSSRQIERALHEDIGFRVLAGQNKVDHDSICSFRLLHRGSLEDLFVQVLKVCERAGLLELDHVAGDGTKVHANASKRKANTLARLREKEADLRTREEKLRKEVSSWLDDLDENDRKDDAKYGKKNGYSVPPELVDASKQREFIRNTIKELEEREREEAKDRGRRSDEPREEAQFNFTDPDSRVMPDSVDKGHFVQAYNAQLAVNRRQIIVGTFVTNHPIDNPHLPEIVHVIHKSTGHYPEEMSFDAGYAKRENLVLLEELGIDGYVSTSKNKRDRIGDKNPVGRPPNSDDPLILMTRKVQTRRGKERYALRKQLVEPVIGQLKQAMGFRRFLLRGLDLVNMEWSMACTAHNLRKLWAAQARAG